MKSFVSIILVFLIVPLLLIGILAAIIKFQILEPKFWEDTFNKNNVYTSLTKTVGEAVTESTIEKGGSRGAIKPITDLITVDNVKDFVDRNLENLLGYANGTTSQLLIYIPVGRAPKGFLPPNFENLPETMPLTSLLTKLNVSGVTPDQIRYISLVGKTTTYLLILDAAIVLLFLIFLVLLADRGKRLIAPGMAFVLGGLIVISLYFAGKRLEIQTAKDLVQKSSTAEALLRTIAPPLMSEILRIWLFIGLGVVVVGILLFLVKKPSRS